MKIYMTNIDDDISLPGQKNMVFLLAGGNHTAGCRSQKCSSSCTTSFKCVSLRETVEVKCKMDLIWWNDAGFPDVGISRHRNCDFFLVKHMAIIFGYLDGENHEPPL